ncbi:MAG: single-stranded DNA-binding protein [Minisyncoccia bacterium]|jgi:single-strand DNA-binding protein
MYLNKTFIIGNLTRDPELKALPSGSKVASFGLATNRVYKDKEGNRQESAEFHNIVAFGRLGELCAQYLKKGAQAFVEGRLQTRSWDAPDGSKKYRTEVIAENVQFGSRSGGGKGSSAEPSSPKSEAPAKDEPAGAETIEYPQEEINPDDIPF